MRLIIDSVCLVVSPSCVLFELHVFCVILHLRALCCFLPSCNLQCCIGFICFVSCRVLILLYCLIVGV
jgi:hypothetical protein